MDKKYLLIAIPLVIILALLLVGGLMRGKSSQPASVLPAGQQQTENVPSTPAAPLANPPSNTTPSADVSRAEIDYTGSGFSPAEVSVKKGTIIVFINKSTKGSMLVESATFAQPSATEVFSFIPNETGTWNYKNRLNATASGTITAK